MTGKEPIQIERSMWMRKEKQTYQDILICIGPYVNNDGNIGLTTVRLSLLINAVFNVYYSMYVYFYLPLLAFSKYGICYLVPIIFYKSSHSRQTLRICIDHAFQPTVF